MSLSTARQFFRTFASGTLPFRNSYIVEKAFVCNKYFSSNGVFAMTEQSRFSTSSTFSKIHSKVTCEGDTRDFDIHYKDLLEAKNDNSVLIIDVREQTEIDETGKLPGSIHIPMGDVAHILTSLPEKDFKEKFDKQKPSLNTKIILSCRSGKRSGMVQAAIQKLGYENVYNYVGGWLDWESNQKV